MPNQNTNTLGASLAALHDSLKPIHPADIDGGIKALSRFMAEQIVIEKPLFTDPAVTPDEYRAVLESTQAAHRSNSFARNIGVYARLLSAVHEWIFVLREIHEADVADDLLIASMDEMRRIASNLGIEIFGYETHRGALPIGNDPVGKYLRETDPLEIIERKGELERETVAA